MSETRETAIEQRLARIALLQPPDSQIAKELYLARDLVRCWREYLAALDDPTISVTSTFAIVAEARALLARGDAP